MNFLTHPALCHDALRHAQLAACEEQLSGQRETVHLLQDELATSDRELALKDEVIKHLQSLLEGEKQARAVDMQTTLSTEQLQLRLASSQIDLAHTTFVMCPLPCTFVARSRAAVAAWPRALCPATPCRPRCSPF